jgi:hypothetical protein
MVVPVKDVIQVIARDINFQQTATTSAGGDRGTIYSAHTTHRKHKERDRLYG